MYKTRREGMHDVHEKKGNVYFDVHEKGSIDAQDKDKAFFENGLQ